MRAAVYSAVYGGYEVTPYPIPADLPCDAVMVTDSPVFADRATLAGWKVTIADPPPFIVKSENGDPAITVPMLKHKYWKTHPAAAMELAEQRRVEAAIWVDGSMRICVDGETFVKANLDALGEDDWSLIPHPWRTCIYDEAVYSATLHYRYDPGAMMRQHDLYQASPWEHPRYWGLFASGHSVRRLTAGVAELSHRWWIENLEHSHQDQISLPVMIRRYAEELGVHWNTRLPWATLWELNPHGA